MWKKNSKIFCFDIDNTICNTRSTKYKFSTPKNKLSKKLFLLRNHGLVNRNNIKIFGTNSRLDAIQAVLANHLLKKIKNITLKRISNADFLDNELRNIRQIKLPKRDDNKEVFHIYSFLEQNRNKLVRYLISKGIDAKKHYPIPMHLQLPSR